MRLVATKKAEQNDAALDPWTVVHIGSGMAAGLLDLPFWPTMAAAVAYELVEHQAQLDERVQRFFTISGPESTANAVMDVIVFAVAYHAGRAYNRL